ncbi:MAG: coproporphyrinogen III oxidase [Hymenobacter sp.]
MPDPHFFATGVSVVLHPRSPRVPIIHMNVRYFEAGNGEAWFGGGIDLTPIYVDETQARRFHERLKAACDTAQPRLLPPLSPAGPTTTSTCPTATKPAG